MKTIYTTKENINKILDEITKAQAKKNIFVNVTVKPYNGKQYAPATHKIVIG